MCVRLPATPFRVQAAALCAFALTLLWSAPLIGQGVGVDPLVSAEIDAALDEALRPMVGAGFRGSTEQMIERLDGMELLLVERARLAKGETGRKATVQLYDYRSDELHYLVVDLTKGGIEKHLIEQGVQPPLNDNEVAESLRVAYNDGPLRRRFREEYQRVTGEVLENSSQLKVKAFSFYSNSRPEGLSQEAQRCGIERCAQLVVSTHDDRVLETTPIISLSRHAVAQRLIFGDTNHVH